MMKLWVKVSGIALACALVAVSVCLYALCAWQTSEILSDAELSARNSLALFCANIESVDSTSTGTNSDTLAGRSVVQYYFATYAHLLSDGAYYSLAQDGEYFYNTCPYDPQALLPLEADAIEAWTTLDFDGERLFAARPLTVLNQRYAAYLCADVSGAYSQVRTLARVCQLMLIATALAVALAVPPLTRRALRPMRDLSNTARQVAHGEYHLRAKYANADEVGALAESFNVMAGAVEDKISALTEESERRRLLLGALSHEIKTPMTAVIGYSGSLLRMPLTEEQKNHCAQQILEAGKRTERIAEKLMQLLSLEDASLEKARFDAQDFTRELAENYGERVRIELSAETLYGDRDLLYSLAVNLVNNALNASDGAVTVIVSQQRISVTDNGRGIPPEHIARLTEPFYRVDKARSRKHGGAGLGLTLVKAIAEAHGGAITIESEIGIFTRVTVTIGQEDASDE